MMGKFLKCLGQHSTMVAVVGALALLASAALLIFWPAVLLQILRYGTAVLFAFLGLYILVSLLRKH